jgi:site-specific DNA-adenine methylase
VQSQRRFPDRLSEKQLQLLKDTRDKASALHIFVGHSCGYHGQYFSGALKQPQADAMLQSANRSIDKLRPIMSVVHVQHADVFQTDAPARGGGIIYCDPPYAERVAKGNTVWNNFQNQVFDVDAFWRQATLWSRNNLVFVSETTAPPDWEVVWSRDWTNQQGPYAYKRKEFLFVHK